MSKVWTEHLSPAGVAVDRDAALLHVGGNQQSDGSGQATLDGSLRTAEQGRSLYHVTTFAATKGGGGIQSVQVAGHGEVEGHEIIRCQLVCRKKPGAHVSHGRLYLTGRIATAYSPTDSVQSSSHNNKMINGHGLSVKTGLSAGAGLEKLLHIPAASTFTTPEKTKPRMAKTKEIITWMRCQRKLKSL